MKFRKAIHGIRETLIFWNNYRIYVKNGGVDESFNDIAYLNYLLHRKNRIISYFGKHDAEKYEHELSCLRRNMPYNMTCDVNDYKGKLTSIEKDLDSITFDQQTGLFFCVRNGKRLYFRKSLNTRKKVEDYYCYLSYEQTVNSPHKYDSDHFCIHEKDILVDCGAAEGLFGLDNIELVDKLYIIEYEEEWITALKQTFKPYQDKVEIISKYLNDSINDEKYSTLDQLFADKKITFIKMDLEGYEYNVLVGGGKILQRKEPLKLAITVYHNKEDESKILEFLSSKIPNFCYERSKGWLLCGWETAEPPFFRTGILRIKI